MDAEVADLWDHRALMTGQLRSVRAHWQGKEGRIRADLHDRAALIVLDVADPLGLVERDVLGEALFVRWMERGQPSSRGGVFTLKTVAPAS